MAYSDNSFDQKRKSMILSKDEQCGGKERIENRPFITKNIERNKSDPVLLSIADTAKKITRRVLSEEFGVQNDLKVPQHDSKVPYCIVCKTKVCCFDELASRYTNFCGNWCRLKQHGQ